MSMDKIKSSIFDKFEESYDNSWIVTQAVISCKMWLNNQTFWKLKNATSFVCGKSNNHIEYLSKALVNLKHIIKSVYCNV